MRYSKGIALIMTVFLLAPTVSTAEEIYFDPHANDKTLSSTKQFTFLTGGEKRDPATVTFSLINTALGMLGFISMLTIMYGGVMWFRSGDNEEHLTKAKGLITGALIGLILAMGALSLSIFLFYAILSPTVTSESTSEETESQ